MTRISENEQIGEVGKGLAAGLVDKVIAAVDGYPATLEERKAMARSMGAELIAWADEEAS